MPCAANCYFHMCRVDSCCQTRITVLFSSLNKYKLSEPWGCWHPWLSLPASPGVSYHSARIPFQPSWPPPTGWHPGLASDAGGAPGSLQAVLVPAGVMGWALASKTLPCHPMGIPTTPSPREQLLPNTNTSTRCKAVEHHAHQLETQVLCECLLGTNQVARGWAWVELVFLWRLLRGRMPCPFCSSMETQVFVWIG